MQIKMTKNLQSINKVCLISLIGASILGVFGYCNMQRQYNKLDLKFTATADSLRDYKVTLQNQGLYAPLRKDVDQLKKYTEGFFESSEKNNHGFGEKLLDLDERIKSLEERTKKK